MKKINLKNIIFVLYILNSFLITFSCNNSSDIKLAYTDKETVKELVVKKESEISWTKELEPERLISENTKSSRIDTSSIVFTPNVAKILKDYNSCVYPELIDFGKLDVSSLSYDVKQKIENFCKDISENFYSTKDAYFDSSYRFNYVFFRNDMINNWKNNFNQNFPITEDEYKKSKENKQKLEQLKNEIQSIKEKIESFNSNNSIDEVSEDKLDEQDEKKSSDKKENSNKKSSDLNKDGFESLKKKLEEAEKELSDFKKQENLKDDDIKDIALFNKWIFGEPFIGDTIIEIPVRFYCNSGSVDVTLFLNYKKQNTIYQISINQWSKK